MQLKAFQKKYLKSISHDLKPNIMIGKNGLTTEVYKQIDENLKANELLKLKIVDKEAEVKELASAIAQKTDSTVLRVVGRTITLYRENPENEKDYFKACGAYGQKRKLKKGE